MFLNKIHSRNYKARNEFEKIKKVKILPNAPYIERFLTV